jgi:hypothetical protein
LALQIGSRKVWLSDFRRLRIGQSPTAILGNQALLAGPVAGLSTVPVAVGGQVLQLDLRRASEIMVEGPKAFPRIPCTVIARRTGAEVARAEARIDLPVGHACFEALRAGQFPPPRRSIAPMTYVSLISSPQMEHFGQGRSYFFQPDVIAPGAGRADRTGVRFWRAFPFERIDGQLGAIFNGAIFNQDHWTFTLEAPSNQTLDAGYFLNPHRVGTGAEWARLSFRHGSRGGSFSGGFVVWEIELAKNQPHVTRLAVDFAAHAAADGREIPALYGMIRLNSTFE